ncbi:MAG TPA: trypsin-like peptidase domain-containing protein [Polyangiaceae bacterium]
MKSLQAALLLALLSACQRNPHPPTTSDPPLPEGAVVVSAPSPPSALSAETSKTIVARGAAAPSSFAELASRADAAVVSVRTVQRRGWAVGLGGVGSAFVYDPAGYLLTNNHVIESASDIRIVFADRRDLPAMVVGRDPLTDIAVLRVAAKGLPHLALGDSDATRVGDWVVAIGNPFGLSHTVSAGIVSAKGRTRRDLDQLGDRSGYYSFLQTDASINPGNSGGPLLDMEARVVGINTAVRQDANNIGFAIPINMVKELLPRLLKEGTVHRSTIGLLVASIDEADALRLHLEDRSGVLVRKIIPGGPADRAGLQVDDIIQAFEGAPTPAPEKLRWVTSLTGSGRPVTLRVRRGTRMFDIRVTLAPLEEKAESPPDSESGPSFDLP